jgi:hypothetical protein
MEVCRTPRLVEGAKTTYQNLIVFPPSLPRCGDTTATVRSSLVGGSQRVGVVHEWVLVGMKDFLGTHSEHIAGP